MTPAIGASAAGTSGVGALLAQSAGQPAAAGGGAPGMSGAPGAGDPAAQDLARQQLEQTMGQIRQLADGVKQLAAANPAVAQEAQQILELFKAMVMKSAQQAPVQTASGMAVPGGGM